jgi:hypothetical protein
LPIIQQQKRQKGQSKDFPSYRAIKKQICVAGRAENLLFVFFGDFNLANAISTSRIRQKNSFTVGI